MSSNSKHSFEFPVTEFGTKPAQLVGNLLVKINVTFRSSGEWRSFDIEEVSWNGMNVLDLIRAMSPDGYDEIQDAAKDYVETNFGQKEVDFVEELKKVVA